VPRSLPPRRSPPAAEAGTGRRAARQAALAQRGVADGPRSAAPQVPDEPDQELVRAHQADRRPGRDHRPDQTVGPALGHVRREGRGDAQREQPPGQGGAGTRCRAACSTTIELA